MTFSKTEQRIIAVGLKLAVVVGFIGCLTFVGSFFIDQPAGARWLKVGGCVIAMAFVAVAYLATCQAVIEAWRRREGA